MEKVEKKYIVSEKIIELINGACTDAYSEKTSSAIFKLGMIKSLFMNDETCLKEI